MHSQIYHFLRRTGILVTNKDARHTHTSIQPAGKFLIEEPNIEDFWDRYCTECHDTRFTITEKPDDVMPVVCDVDIKIEQTTTADGEKEKEADRLYDETMVLSLVQVYHSVLFEILDDLKEEDFLCCVLEKDPYVLTKNGKTYRKNGFHLHFPRIFLSRYIQETELVPRIVQEVKKKNISKTFPFEKCIDGNYCKGKDGKSTGWLMYGSSKSADPSDPMYQPYQVSYCIDHNMERLNYRNALEDYHIYSTNQQQINFSAEDLDFYLPRILSVFMFHRNEYLYDLKEDLPSIQGLNVSSRRINEHGRTFTSPYESNSDLELIERLTDVLASHRYEDRNEWMNVGWILYNITNGSPEGLELWLRFSQKCPDKFDRSACVYQWGRMEKRDVTVGSLKYLAKLDNEDEYRKLISEFMKPHITKSIELNGSHNDIAKALYEKYEAEYVCVNITNRVWYQFRDHIWTKLDEGITLRTKISEEIADLYFDVKNKLDKDLKHYHSEENKDMENRTRKTINTVMSLIGKLKSAPFKNNIMREAMEVFHSEEFLKKLDSDPNLIAFQNGVYDVRNHEFRDGRPSDYLSLKLPIHFRQDLDKDHPDVQMVHEFLAKMFPDKTVREYFLNLASEVFVGGNHSKIFQIWTGEGDNGKSIMQTVFEKMLGSYSIKLPTSLITGKRTQSSAACPELVRAGNGVRLAMLQEPDQTDTINIGILKELSGNDTFFARGLYKEGTEITPMFKLVLICNDPPKLPYNDRATWNRIRVIPFESTFTDDAPESWEEQLRQKRFVKDKDFASKIPRLVEPFAWLLLHTLKYKRRVTVEPEKVRMATNNYRKKNDIYKQFIDEFVVSDKTARVSLMELYSVFKDWFRDSMPTQNGMPTKSEMKEYFVKVWGSPVDKMFWDGYAIRNIYDTPSEGSATTPPSMSGVTFANEVMVPL